MISPNVKESKTVLDSGFHAVDSGFQVLDCTLFVSATWILGSIFSRIPNSLNCIPDNDSKAEDFGFHKQNFPRFRIPQAKSFQIADSTSKNFVESEIRIPLHVVT